MSCIARLVSPTAIASLGAALLLTLGACSTGPNLPGSTPTNGASSATVASATPTRPQAQPAPSSGENGEPGTCPAGKKFVNTEGLCFDVVDPVITDSGKFICPRGYTLPDDSRYCLKDGVPLVPATGTRQP